jgi:carbonic anhydrase
VTADEPMSRLDRVLADNARYVARLDGTRLPQAPARKLAVLTCMDARLAVEEMLGLRTGDASIIRNAGALATDDAIRSIVVSQHLLGTDEVIVVGHTGCGMLRFTDEAMRTDLARRTGRESDLRFHAFDDLDASVHAQVERIRSHPWTKAVAVYGLVVDVETGRVREVV